MSESRDFAAQRAFYTGFIAVLVACFTPFKVVAYVLPLGFLAWMQWQAPSTTSRNRLTKLVLALLAGAVFYDLVAPELLVANYAVAAVTYCAFAPILVIESRRLASRELLHRSVLAASTMIAVQGCVGIVQAVNGALQAGGSFGGANGDRVAGTIYPYLHPELAFSNPMFAVNMTMMLLACVAVPEVASRRRGYLVLGTIALVLASVLHVLLMLVASVVLAFLLLRRTRAPSTPRKTSRYLLATVALVGGLSYVALSDNVEAITRIGETAVDLDAVDIPRAVLLTRVFTELPDDAPLQPFIGVGPGQFSSRASLIVSGLYLGGPDSPKPIPFLDPQATRLAYDYCLSLMIAWTQSDLVVGSTQQPFFSWLSIYTELGLAGLVLVIYVLVRVLRTVRRRVREQPSLQLEGVVFTTGALLLAMLGLQENYWESPQAILIGLLLLKMLYANIVYSGEGHSPPPPHG